MYRNALVFNSVQPCTGETLLSCRLAAASSLGMRSTRRACTRSLSTAAPRPRVKRIGQAMAFSHPHQIRPGELTPGITAKEYMQRRKLLVDQLPQNSFASLGGQNVSCQMTSRSLQFLLPSLTLEQPDAHMIISNIRDPQKPDPYHLFVRPRDAAREIWDGPRAGTEGALEYFGVTEASKSSDLESALHSLAKRAKSMFHDSLPERLVESVKAANPSLVIGDAETRIERLRVVKSPAEVNLMRTACRESGHAFAAAMECTRGGMSQHQLEAVVEFHSRMRGARQLGYPPVVASGIDNNTLHYVANDEILRDGELILMDAGGEFNGYNADITRCWPVNGRFTPAQKRVYEAVLNVQQACIEACKPGFSLTELYGLSFRLIAKELEALGVLPTHPSDALNACRRCYPHSIGHYLGMDIHDCQSVSNSEVFVPGMIVTVEPGIYLPDEPSVPAELRGIGIRIEDDVLITSDGHEVLTATAPKEIEDIERRMRSTPLKK